MLNRYATVGDMAKKKTVAAVVWPETERALKRIAKGNRQTVSWTIARILEKQTGTAMKAKIGKPKSIARKVGGRAAPGKAGA
jgi:hypothetical protein